MRTTHWHNWTPQEDRFIVTTNETDKALAALIGCTVRAVRMRRYNLNLGTKSTVRRISTREMAERVMTLRQGGE